MPATISVIIPTYQHARSLPRCLEAIFAQTYPAFEIIVVDDGSTDDTATVLARYSDKITVITQPNAGSNPARNRGLQAAQGELVIFCDADVTMAPNMLAELQQALVDHPEASYAYTSFWFGWKYFAGREFDAQALRKFNYIHTSSLVRRTDFPGFDEAIKRLQDWDVWLTMLEQGKVGVFVPNTSFAVSIDGASRIGSSWLPAFVYALPWQQLGWKPRRVQKYLDSKAIIQNKHKL